MYRIYLTKKPRIIFVCKSKPTLLFTLGDQLWVSKKQFETLEDAGKWIGRKAIRFGSFDNFLEESRSFLPVRGQI